jgi:hypothetical protein
MDNKKNAKNMLTVGKVNPVFPPYRHNMESKYVKRVLQLDAETVPGAEFYSEANWIVPGDTPKEGILLFDSHTHTFGELISFCGYDYEDIQDLGAEIEFTVDNEKHVVTKSFAAFIPAGVQHGPLIVRNVRKPVFQMIAADAELYE